jgi:hypothetical protein
MRRAARRRVPAAFEAPAGLTEEVLCRESYQQPVEQCPIYTEYFKDTDQIPGRLCTIHKGTVKQRMKRAIEGFFSGLGKKIKGILK